MKLSKLVYLCVKNAVYYDDMSFTYEAFLQGKYDVDPDYSTNIHNVFQPLNMAVTRLNDTDRLPFAIRELVREEVTSYETEADLRAYLISEGVRLRGTESLVSYYNNNGIEYSVEPENLKVTKRRTNTFNEDCGDVLEVMGIGAIEPNGYVRPLNYLIIHGKNTIRILSNVYPTDKIYMEYKKDIPFLSNSENLSEEGAYYNYDFIPDAITGEMEVDTTTEVDINLRESFGVTDVMCNYIIEYVRAYLLEPIDVQLSNLHLSRAEQYFRDIPAQTSAFNQRNIEVIWGIDR